MKTGYPVVINRFIEVGYHTVTTICFEGTRSGYYKIKPSWSDKLVNTGYRTVMSSWVEGVWTGYQAMMTRLRLFEGIQTAYPAVVTSYMTGIQTAYPAVMTIYMTGIQTAYPAVMTIYMTGIQTAYPAVMTSYMTGIQTAYQTVTVSYIEGIKAVMIRLIETCCRPYWPDSKNRAQERLRAGRWSRALIAGWFVLLQCCSSTLAFRTLSLTFAPHSCWNSSWRSTQTASRWRGPHLLHSVVLAVADGLFGLCESVSLDELFISTRPPPPPLRPTPISPTNKPYGFCGRKAPRKRKIRFM